MLLCTGALGHGAFLPGVFTFRPVQRSVPEWSPGAATAAGTLSSAQPPREACAGHSIEDIIPYLYCFEKKWPGAQDSVSRTDPSTDSKTCSVGSPHDYYDNDAFPKVLSFSLGQWVYVPLSSEKVLLCPHFLCTSLGGWPGGQSTRSPSKCLTWNDGGFWALFTGVVWTFRCQQRGSSPGGPWPTVGYKSPSGGQRIHLGIQSFPWAYPVIDMQFVNFHSWPRLFRVVEDPPANAGDIRDAGSIPGSGRFPGRGHGNPLQYSCLENPHEQRSLVGYSPWGRKELDMTEAN